MSNHSANIQRVPFTPKPLISQENRPVIQWQAGQLPHLVDQAEEALINSPIEIYQRGSMLVRPVVSGPTTVHSTRYAAGTVHLHAVDAPWLTDKMTLAATWVKAGKNGTEPINAPPVVANTYMARVGEWRVKNLVSIIEAPTLRPDGSILDQPGYDAETGLLFKPGMTFSPIPQNPARPDAMAALEVLRDIIKDFPFAEPHDESIAISAMATALVRPSLHSAPMHAFRAPKMASGKSFLVDIVAMIATGRPAPTMGAVQDPNEERKRIFALLMNGDSIASVDNIEHPWASDVMCTVLTQPVLQDRILGQSKTITVPCRTFWMCTGNNLTFKGDLTTRVLPCDLDPRTEQPGERSFDRDLKEHVPAHRDELVRAALTILRAHHLAGRPNMGLKPYGRFEDWSNWVRSALVWLGMPDPCLSIADLEDADPIRQHLRNFLRSWHGLFGDRPTTVAEAVAAAKLGMGEGAELFKEALEEISAKEGVINQRIIGHFMAKYAKRIECGLRIEKAGERKNAVQWRVIESARPSKNSPGQVHDLTDKTGQTVSLVSYPPANPNNEEALDGGMGLQTHGTPPSIPRPAQDNDSRVVSLFTDNLPPGGLAQ